MESKKFVNLSSEYRDFLTACSSISGLDKIDGKTDLISLSQIHTQVEKCLSPLDLQISDINHLLSNYLKLNEQLEQLKKLVYYRNYYVITNCLRTDQWKKFICELKSKSINVKTKQVENSVMELLKKYMGTWDTIEKIIVMDKKGSIRSIELIDPDDYEFIFNLLKK